MYNKLIRWASDNYPPIDLNANVQSVVELIAEHIKLKAALEALQQATPKQASDQAHNILRSFNESADAPCDLNTKRHEIMSIIDTAVALCERNNILENALQDARRLLLTEWGKLTELIETK